MKLRSWLAGAAIIILSTACTTEPTKQPMTSFMGTVVGGSGSAMGVGMYFYDPTISDVTSASTVFQPDPSNPFYVTAPTPVGAAGRFEFPLPDVDDLPDALFLPASEFFPIGDYVTSPCTLVTDDDAAEVTFHVFGLLTSPGIYAYAYGEGEALALASDAEFDFAGDGDVMIVSWLYSTRPVRVESSGECTDAEDTTYTVDLDLVAGWNQVAWRSPAGGSDVTLSNDATSPVVVTVVGGS